MTFKSFLLLALLPLMAACRKEAEQLVVQEAGKPASWTPASRLYGTAAIVVQMSKSNETILLQTPFFLNIVSPYSTSAPHKKYGYVGSLAAYFPSDINQRLAISQDFIAQPVQDTLVKLLRPAEAGNITYNTYVNLRQLSRKATGVIWPDGVNHPSFGAINRNNYLLFGYRVSTYDGMLHFGLVRVGTQATGGLQAQPLAIQVPLGPGILNSRPRWIQAIDDYFVVNCGDAGLYKIKQDGTASRVYGPSVTDACYKWQGTVYLVEEYNSVLLSKDNGETWQRSTGSPNLFDLTSYHVVGDSLVGVSHQLISQIFTLRWKDNSYSVRILKNDGLERTEVRGLEQLGDTVYIGTTNGLFKRPLNKFFEDK
jgi:hypothetical protein